MLDQISRSPSSGIDHLDDAKVNKRAGKTFSVPATKRVRRVALTTLTKHAGKALADAVTQARRYCVSVGTQPFIVTNGFQWVASLAFAQNVNADNLSAVVYYGLDDISENLQEFIGYLSPDGIAEQRLASKAISGGDLVPAFAKRLNDEVHDYPPQTKNYLSSQMTALMDICFKDITDREHADMLRHCYVHSEATDQYLKQLELFVGANLPASVSSSAAKLDRRRPETIMNAPSGEVSLVVGRMGSGKSTFLAMTKQRLAERFETNRHLVLHLDLVDRTQIHADVFDHDQLVSDVCTDLLTEARELYPAHDPFAYDLLTTAFNREIAKLKSSKGPRTSQDAIDKAVDDLIAQHLKSPLHHLKAYLGYLYRHEIAATILLDNVDRGTPAFERLMYQLAQTLAKNSGASIVISMRDTTYNAGKKGGFLDVGQPTVFTVSPPSFVDVARKRFEYAHDRLSSDPALWRKFSRRLDNVPPERVFDFAGILAESVLAGNSAIEECIRFLASTNIRLALGLLKDLATSSHTDLNLFFRTYQRAERLSQSDIPIPFGSFLRPVMRASRARYSEKGSNIANLFQASQQVTTSHLTAIRILQFLRWQLNQERERADVLVSTLVDRMSGIGIGGSDVLTVLNHIGKYGLVTSPSSPEPPWTKSDSVRLGAPGHYYLETLMTTREYVEGVVGDTVIYDQTVFDTLLYIHKDKTKDGRTRAEEKLLAFLQYLAKREQSELDKSGVSASRPQWLSPVGRMLGERFFGTSFSQSRRAATRKSDRPPPARKPE